jgi:formylglycine-generating enzyme required for sulfatase activity
MEDSTAAFRIEQVKRFIYDDYPVVIGLAVTPSFQTLTEVWRPEEHHETHDDVVGGHAVCVVGYDDAKYGGAFEIMNSWGEEWGLNGFGWIPYGAFGNFVLQAWSLSDDAALDTAPVEYTASIKIDAGKNLSELPVRLTAEGLYQPRAAVEPGAPLHFVFDNGQSPSRNPLYVYIFCRDGKDNTITKVFPAGSNAAAVPAGSTGVSADAGTAGKDFIILYSHTALNAVDFMNTFRKKTGTVLQRVRDTVGPIFISYNRIKYNYTAVRGTVNFVGNDDVMGLVVSVSTGAEKTPLDMVKIKGGSFVMGSPSSEQGRDDDEGQTKVAVDDFYIGAHEVTVGDFKEFVKSTNYKTTAERNGHSVVFTVNSEFADRQGINWQNPGYTQEDNQPVVHVSWFDAVEYCNWRSRQENYKPVYTVTRGNVRIDAGANGYRLPTEAEWEYACRAGTATAYNTGTAIDNRRANFLDAFQFKMTPVGRYSPNAWGLYDMHGNVLELCQNFYQEGVAMRSTRGGFWLSNGQQIRSAYRSAVDPGYSYVVLGFRLARTAK